MNRQVFAQRRERLRALMFDRRLDALLVSLDANRYYLSGFELHDPQVNESAGRLLVCANGKDWLFTDARYLDAAKRLWDAERVFIYSGKPPEEMGSLIAGLGLQRVGFEAKILALDVFERLGSAVEWVRADTIVETLRQIKDDDELARMTRACALNHQLMEALPAQLVPGQSEADTSWFIERFFREGGASGLAFPNIVGFGPNGALPHYIPSSQVRLGEEDSVLIDVGCRVDDYCSDQTRSFWVGSRPSDVFLRALDAVQAAQSAAIAMIRPGVRACDVYQVAYAHFDRLGVAAAFTHSLGHGIGLQTHEGPSLNSRNETLLSAGMVITVEPGLYYPEWGGVRWEHMVLVTEDGSRVF